MAFMPRTGFGAISGMGGALLRPAGGGRPGGRPHHDISQTPVSPRNALRAICGLFSLQGATKIVSYLWIAAI